MSFFKDSRILSIPIISIVFILLEIFTMVGNIKIPRMVILIVGLYIAVDIYRRHIEFERLVLAFFLYLPIEIYIAQPDIRFHSYERLLMFVAMLASVSPLMQSQFARSFRSNALYLFLITVMAVSLASFAAYFLDINYMVRFDSNEYLGIAGHFGGFYNHSMNLGSMSAVSAIYLIYRGLVSKKKWYYIPALLCIGCVMFSASRGAFFGLAISFLFLLRKYSKNNKQFIQTIVFLLLCALMTTPLWIGALSGLEDKQMHNIEMGGIVNSRSEKWVCRLEEFFSSPVFGVGFSSIDPYGNDPWIKETGSIEPGSSWLSILSMTGMIGFAFFSTMYYRAQKFVNSISNDRCIILYALLIFFSIHMLVEGYIFAAGSPSCIMLWLVLSNCYDLKYETKEHVITI